MFAFNPWKSRSGMIRSAPRKSQTHTGSNPVLLVPGYRDNSSVFRKLTDFLRDEGFDVHPLTLQPSDGRLPLNQLAEQVSEYVEKTFVGSEQLNFIGFSMGGIVVRYYLQRLGGLARTERLITLGSPHRGTWMAYYSGRPGVRQMRPGSSFLMDLAKDEATLDQIHFTSIWTPLDLTIMPSSSSVIRAGQQKRLLLPYHRALVTSNHSLQSIVQSLLEQRPVSSHDDSLM
jgi:triacylglycerol lipase